MSIIQIKETCLYIRDLEGAEAFYHKKLGFPLISRVEGRHVFFRSGTSVLLCFNPNTTREEKELPSHFAEGPQHIAFEVRRKDYLSWKKRIEAAGIKITHEAEWPRGHHSFYFEDPEKNVLEIVEEGMWGPF